MKNKSAKQVLLRAAAEAALVVAVIWAIRMIWGAWAGFVPSTSGEPLWYLLLFFDYTVVRGALIIWRQP